MTPIQTEVPPEIERAAQAYLKAMQATDAAWAKGQRLTREGTPPAEAYREWKRLESEENQLRNQLHASFHGQPATYRVGDHIVEMSRRITRKDPLSVRRVRG